jgi:hypothetical protein
LISFALEAAFFTAAESEHSMVDHANGTPQLIGSMTARGSRHERQGPSQPEPATSLRQPQSRAMSWRHFVKTSTGWRHPALALQGHLGEPATPELALAEIAELRFGVPAK